MMKKTKNLQTEIDASFLYQRLAYHDMHETIDEVFRQMNLLEQSPPMSQFFFL